MLPVILALSFATVVLFIIGLTMQSEREIMVERMESHAHGMKNIKADFGDVQTPFIDRVILPALRKLSALAVRLTPKGALKTIDQQLETAGRPWGLGALEFVGLRVLSIAVFVVLAILVSSRFGQASLLLRIALMGLMTIIGLVLPDAILNGAVANRQASIRKTLPDTLDLLTVSVEAGLGLDGAMQKVIEKLQNPLSDELRRALQEMRAGKRRAEALRDMAARVRVQELSTFVASIIQAEQLGVSIAKVLRVQSESLRVSRAIKARESATKLPVKMLFPLVLCIFPALFVVVLAPGAIQIGRALGLLAK